MSLAQRLFHEFKSAAAVTLYFLFCFGMVLVFLKLFLARYDIELDAIARVVFGALVIGKVVVVLDNTRLGERFSRHRAVYDILYRSLVYTLIVLAVASIEGFVHAYRETGGAQAALQYMAEHRVEGKSLGSMLLIGLSFLALNTVLAFNRVLGPGTVRRVLLGRIPESRQTETRS